MRLCACADIERAVAALLERGPLHCDAETIACQLQRAGYELDDPPRMRGESAYPSLRYVLWLMRRDGITELTDGKLRLTSWGRKWVTK